MTKVIFADRAAIDECANRILRKQKAAEKHQMRERADLLATMREVHGGKDFFKLVDVANVLQVPRNTEATITISCMPKTMAELRKSPGLPPHAALQYLEQI